MQTYYKPSVGVVNYIDGEITQSQLQGIGTSPVQLFANATGRTLAVFFSFFFRMEISNIGFPFSIFITSQYNINVFGQNFGSLDIPAARADSYYVIQPSMNGVFVDSPIYTAQAITSDNNLVLHSATNDVARQLARNIQYRLFYSLYSI